MDILQSLATAGAASLLGRDPRSLVQDVLDDAAQDQLADEMRALDALIAPHLAELPVGRAGVLAAEMSPLLCSLFRDPSEICPLLAYVHSWVSTLGDVAATARRVDGARQEALLVVAERGVLDDAALETLPEDDRDAVLRYRDLDRRHTSEVSLGDWRIRLRVHDHQTLAAVLCVDDMRAVVGVAHVDQDQGPRATTRVPELTA